MFKLEDGREYLYQWDLNRNVIVEDPEVTEVHFCNKTDDCSLVVEVKDGKAQIPNILLQDTWNIRVYAYCQDYTKVEESFKIKPRTRPSDYVYTETEVRTWNEFNDTLDSLVVHLDFSRVTSASYEATEEEAAIFERMIEKEPIAVYITGNADLMPMVALAEYELMISGSAYKSIYFHTHYYRRDGNTQTSKLIATCYRATKSKSGIDGSWMNWKISVIEDDNLIIASTEYVDEAIKNVETGGVDLSDYYNKEEVDSAITEAINSIDTTIPEEYITETELEGYAKTTDIPTDEHINSLINDALGVIENGTY